jgi:hypothetical protein
LLCEISYHVLEPVLQTTLTQNSSVGPETVTIGSTLGIYVGAQIIVDANTPNQEAVTVTAFVPGTSITATFANSHNSGASVFGPTFSTQAIAGDPFFTQSEVLGYLSRAQNEFLARVPCIFQFFYQSIAYGQIYQSTPSTCIEIERIALATIPPASFILLDAASQAWQIIVTNSGIVDTTPVAGTAPTGILVNDTASGLTWQLTIVSVGGSSGILHSAPMSSQTPSAPTQLPLIAPNGMAFFLQLTNGIMNTAVGSFASLPLTRLYEVSQEQLTMQDRNWQSEFQLYPKNWWEDRGGNYRWGVGGKPSSSFPVELLCSIRDTDSLALTDGFAVPDLVLHYVKYKTLEYMFSKDGEERSEQLASYCHQRFEMGVVATTRWIKGMMNSGQQAKRRSA